MEWNGREEEVYSCTRNWGFVGANTYREIAPFSEKLPRRASRGHVFTVQVHTAFFDDPFLLLLAARLAQQQRTFAMCVTRSSALSNNIDLTPRRGHSRGEGGAFTLSFSPLPFPSKARAL